MPDHDNSKILIDLVTPEVMGVFWITKSPLRRSLAGFDQLNYLFDGLISQFVASEEVSEKRANIFFTENFNQTIFLAHLNISGISHSEIAGEIDEQIALIQANAKGRKRLLVIQDSDSDWDQQLNKRYPQFNFQKILL